MLLPKKQPNPENAPMKHKDFHEQYDVERCRARLRVAKGMCEGAETITDKDEQVWSSLLKDTLLHEYAKLSNKTTQSNQPENLQDTKVGYKQCTEARATKVLERFKTYISANSNVKVHH